MTAALLGPTPLIAALERAARDTGWERDRKGREYRVGPGRWAATRGVCSERQYDRWKAGSRVKVDTADRAAIALGYHPCELWGDDWWTRDEGEAA